MATSALGTVIHNLRHVLLCQGETGFTDGELLDKFISRQDEFAFETLVRRHGPMVLGVCRRILRNDTDADDAFQATFLVLVRKAASIRPRSKVGNWLYGVARSTALKARAMSIKRSAKERASAARPSPEASPTSALLTDMLDEELQALPEKYRAAIVLCDLEGRSLKDVARQQLCPLGTVGTRLARGRALLAQRLARRGVALPASAVAATLAQANLSAALSPALVSSTVMAATATAAGQATTAGVISVHVAAITEGVLKTMLLAKLKIATVYLVAASTLGFAAAWASQPSSAGTEAPRQAGLNPAQRDAAAHAAADAAGVRVSAKEKAQEIRKTDDGWGEPVGGVKIRLQGPLMKKGEMPEFSVLLKNEMGGELSVPRMPRCELEVDGVWYVSMELPLVAGASVVRTGDTKTLAIIRIGFPDDKKQQLAGRWVLKSAVNSDREILQAFADPKNRLIPTAGKHTIRVACNIDRLVGDSAVRVGRAVSNRIENIIAEPDDPQFRLKNQVGLELKSPN